MEALDCLEGIKATLGNLVFFPALNIAFFHLLPPTRVNLSSLRCIFGHDESNCWNIFPHADRKMCPKGRFQRGMKESIQGSNALKSSAGCSLLKLKPLDKIFFVLNKSSLIISVPMESYKNDANVGYFQLFRIKQ